MAEFFLIFSLIILALFIVGIIWPQLLTKLFRNRYKFTRKSIAVIFTSLFIGSMVMVGATAPKIDDDQESIVSEAEASNQDLEAENSELLNEDNGDVSLEQNSLDPSPSPTHAPSPSPSLSPTPTPTTSPTHPPAASPSPKPTSVVTPAPEPSTPEQAVQTSSSCQEGQVNINTASQDELVRIIHIDTERSQQILTLRPFASVDSMTRIKGIGAARLSDIKGQGLACI